jgi:putative transcriptional regulator
VSTLNDDLLDPFLLESEGADVLPWLGEAQNTRRPGQALRDRIVRSATGQGRLARFAEAAADMLDLSREAAQTLLDRVDDPCVWSPGLAPGMTLYHVQGGPRVQGAITGFVRIESGAGFPEHEHLGDEEVLIVQGTCLDSVESKVCRPGDRVRMAAGSAHSFHVRPGPDFLYLAVVFRGIRVGEQELRADDPRM